MIISLNTENLTLCKIFDIRILGPFIILLFALTPIPLMFIANGIFDITTNEYLERINAMIAGLWNTLLYWYFRIKISIFFIPCWILFLILGALRYFDIIGS